MFPENYDEFDEIDAILRAIENHTRREILRMLVEGRQYALQMARELRTSQQAIMKHLDVLEKRNMIRMAGEERSERGAPRKLYEISKTFSLFIDFAPGIFEIREYSLDDVDTRDIREEFRGMDYGEILKRIEEEIKSVERRRVKLLKLKEEIISEMIELSGNTQGRL